MLGNTNYMQDTTFPNGPSVFYSTQPPKYYWVLYETRNNDHVSKCITVHPFDFIYTHNLNEPNQKWGRIILINWKEISKAEYSLWVKLNTTY